jgi:hypothetical protein
MNMEPLREFVSLEKKKKDLDAELKAANQRLDELEQIIIPLFIEDGVPSMAVEADGMTRMLSIYQDVYASPINDRGEVVGALKESELGQYVAENYNTNSLTSYVRELWKELKETARREGRIVTEADLRTALPSALQPVLKISLLHKLSSTRSSKTTK